MTAPSDPGAPAVVGMEWPTPPPPVVAILGYGAHGRAMADVLTARGVSHVAYDDDPGGPVPASIADYLVALSPAPYYIGAAWPEVRRHIEWRVTSAVRHVDVPSRTSFSGPCGRGRFLFPGAVVAASADLGLHVHVGASAVVSHGCDLGDFVTVCPGAVLSGDVVVGPDAVIGAGAVVIHGGITIGDGAFVGAGAVVVDEVPAGVVVAGNPARVVADRWDHREMVEGRRRRAPGAST